MNSNFLKSGQYRRLCNQLIMITESVFMVSD